MGLGTIQAGLNFFRRWSVSGAVTGMEKTIRDDVYHHLQRLDPAFHDSWQSGQLLSRATNDLSTIRRFAGFGVVFFITNTWTFLLIVALLIQHELVARPADRSAVPPVTVLCLRFEKKYRVLSRRYQDQTGRPGHLRGGSGNRHPGAQVAGPPGRGRRPAPGPGQARLPHARWTRPGCAARSGPAWIWYRTP